MQVALTQLARSKFTLFSLEAMRPSWRRLQGLASGGYVTKYVTKVGKGQLIGMPLALESVVVRTTDFFGKLWLQVHAAEQVGEARVGAQRIMHWVHFDGQ